MEAILARVALYDAVYALLARVPVKQNPLPEADSDAAVKPLPPCRHTDALGRDWKPSVGLVKALGRPELVKPGFRQRSFPGSKKQT